MEYIKLDFWNMFSDFNIQQMYIIIIKDCELYDEKDLICKKYYLEMSGL